MDFEVLASAYAFYGILKRNEILKNREDLKNKIITAFWARSKFGYTIFDYKSKSWNTDKPLIYAGYDNEKVPEGVLNIIKLLGEIKEGLKFNISEHDNIVLDSLISSVYTGRVTL